MTGHDQTPGMPPEQTELRRTTTWTMLATGALALGLGAGVAARAAEGIHAAPIDAAAVRAAVALRLPRTAVSSVDCRGLGGWCEIVSNRTVFYVDPSARFLFVGHVYDMEARSDVTAARLLALNPDAIAAGAAGRRDDPAAPARAEAPASPAKVVVGDLPAGGAIRWGPTNGAKVIVLSDFQCGYCRKLSATLAAIGARVEEHPISIFGAASRRIAEQVLCARDQAAALRAAYAGQSIADGPRCDVSGLDANEAFARKHGFGGTPILIRPDGTVAEGYRDAEELKAFLTGRAR